MKEWKKIEGYDYEVSNHGDVRSIDKVVTLSNGKKRKYKSKEMKQRMNHGYMYTAMVQDGTQKQIQTHRLVARAFIPNTHNKPQVNHIDGNKANNHVNNLEWVTAKENIEHARKNGLLNSSHQDKKLTENDVKQIKMMILGGQSDHDIAEIVDSTPSRINKIRNGKAWSHVTVQTYS